MLRIGLPKIPSESSNPENSKSRQYLHLPHSRINSKSPQISPSPSLPPLSATIRADRSRFYPPSLYDDRGLDLSATIPPRQSPPLSHFFFFFSFFFYFFFFFSLLGRKMSSPLIRPNGYSCLKMKKICQWINGRMKIEELLTLTDKKDSIPPSISIPIKAKTISPCQSQ
ncbi:hypothetical protein AMTRI_Chr11g96460 [Amborella trichopoda]